MMPYPGRRAKKAVIWTLATILIFLTVIGGILPIMPELDVRLKTNGSEWLKEYWPYDVV